MKSGYHDSHQMYVNSPNPPIGWALSSDLNSYSPWKYFSACRFRAPLKCPSQNN